MLRETGLSVVVVHLFNYYRLIDLPEDFSDVCRKLVPEAQIIKPNLQPVDGWSKPPEKCDMPRLQPRLELNKNTVEWKPSGQSLGSKDKSLLFVWKLWNIVRGVNTNSIGLSYVSTFRRQFEFQPNESDQLQFYRVKVEELYLFLKINTFFLKRTTLFKKKDCHR